MTWIRVGICLFLFLIIFIGNNLLTQLIAEVWELCNITQVSGFCLEVSFQPHLMAFLNRISTLRVLAECYFELIAKISILTC